MKIGFFGFGNMAQAMAKGLVGQNAVNPADIYACARDWNKLRSNTEPFGFVPCESAEQSQTSRYCCAAYSSHAHRHKYLPG